MLQNRRAWHEPVDGLTNNASHDRVLIGTDNDAPAITPHIVAHDGEQCRRINQPVAEVTKPRSFYQKAGCVDDPCRINAELPSGFASTLQAVRHPVMGKKF